LITVALSGLLGCESNSKLESNQIIVIGFDEGISEPNGWSFSGVNSIYDSDENYGIKSPSIRLDDSDDQITSPKYGGQVQSISFWYKGLGTDSESYLTIEGYNGHNWVEIQKVEKLDEYGTVIKFDNSSNPTFPKGIQQVRIRYSKHRGNVAIDDIELRIGDVNEGPVVISEGKIVYKLTYPQFEDDNIFTSMFPREMAFKFKDDNTVNELKTSMAVFSTSLFANNKEKKVTHLVRIANKYSGLEMDSVEIMKEYGKKPVGMKITPTDSTKQIAGYKCHHAFVTFEGDSTKNFSIFYTNDIGIKDPNWCTPFYEISGVLMEAQVNKFNIDMHMIATLVVAEEYPAEDFIITKEYQPITVQEMADIFQSF